MIRRMSFMSISMRYGECRPTSRFRFQAALTDNPVSAAAHLRGRFSARDLTVPDRPSGRLKLNLGCSSPLVETVVPFPEVILRPGDVPISRKAARLPSTGKRTRQDEGKALAAEPPAEPHRFPLAGNRKGWVRAPCVLPSPAPIGLAVPDDPDVGSSLVHRLPGAAPLVPSGDVVILPFPRRL